MKNFVASLIPRPVMSVYHRAWAHGSAWRQGNPSKKLFVIGITGTKGKSSVSELTAEVLRAAGHKVALASTIHFVIDDKEEPNLFKMTMPGRGYLQRFLRKAVDAGCTHAVIEMTSEGALQHRHAGIEMDALIFTNLEPEHIERHGSFEAYADAKLSIARALASSRKRPRLIVANADDAYGEKFLETPVELRVPFSLKDAEPYTADDRGSRFVYKSGELFTTRLPGIFNLKNCLAVLALCEAMEIPLSVAKKTLEHAAPPKGRAQTIERGQPFTVVVDYAHTPGSLKALYETYQNKRLLCVLGSTGGGRDKWKRPEMGKAADQHCSMAFLTDDDSYDEDPQRIVEEIASGFVRVKPKLIVDRRAAIREALKAAEAGDAVLITGKGTDPFLMGPRGAKVPWSDERVATEELQKLGYH
jgi:UDP-N-acetylmuramoyl-L-alanyl-D-glutamate--2,6-diaminopimelate ligase